MGFLSNIFGFKSVDYKSLSKAGAIIIDVRTSLEFEGGHIKGSKNIELLQLKNQLNKIPKH